MWHTMQYPNQVLFYPWVKRNSPAIARPQLNGSSTIINCINWEINIKRAAKCTTSAEFMWFRKVIPSDLAVDGHSSFSDSDMNYRPRHENVGCIATETEQSSLAGTQNWTVAVVTVTAEGLLDYTLHAVPPAVGELHAAIYREYDIEFFRTRTLPDYVFWFAKSPIISNQYRLPLAVRLVGVQ